jgi:hypothetical protein
VPVSSETDEQIERARRIHAQIETLKRKPPGKSGGADADRERPPKSPRDFIADKMKDLDSEGGE